MSDIKSYINDLFRYIDTYENNYPAFQAEAFFQTYNGIYTVFQALRQQRNDAVEVDYVFLDHLKESPLTSSDLRQLTIQLMVSYFESEADVDGRSNQAYEYCRNLRPVKQDVSFFDNHLLPLLFEEGSLNNNFELNAFFLNELARFMKKFGKPVQANLSPEAFAALPEPLKILELARRREELGPELVRDRTSLEFHLQQVDAFNKLGTRGKLYDQYLSKWNYLVTTSFWSRIRGYLGVFWGKIKGAFSNWKYFKLVITQRNPAYMSYGGIIVIMLALAVLVPSWWGDYKDSELEVLKQRANQVQQGGDR